ncbi:hypothetical protein CRE_11620 [Caenorhabditis remanei]|uniref:Uncharacterized protein n=1 Tax=Caenorhabditis remanei TaxID=31234 RepID=E3NTW0_CAERE|nr:hypothetical protein CRE_11620 [Caenorhabditis remanei]
MKGHNSEGSCVYGLCGGTFHKTTAPSRSLSRPGQLTRNDARAGTFGFGSTPSVVLDYTLPYETPIDILHNAAEGIYSTIMSELLPNSRNHPRKSDLFQCDHSIHSKLCESVFVPLQYKITRMSSGSEKITVSAELSVVWLIRSFQYFRMNCGLAALVNPSLKPYARLSILSLMLITNQLYSNSSKGDKFFEHMTSAARWTLETASKTYMTTKVHELVSHLPEVITMFGNVACLSTFSFEHFYKYCLKGFNAQKTKGFSESALKRVFLHSAVRREIRNRLEYYPSKTITDFLKVTPQWDIMKVNWKSRILQLKPEDAVPEIKNVELFSVLNLPYGKLTSTYKKEYPSDIFFGKTSSGFHSCFRFVGVGIKDQNTIVLAERIRSINPALQFPLVQKEIEEMAHPANTYGSNVLFHLKRYSGLVHGRCSGEMEVLNINDIKGLGAYLRHGDATYYLQVNGAFVHN